MDKSASFNADFYVTAATIIPIFYLALTLQGNFYKGLLTKLADYAEVVNARRTGDRYSWQKSLVAPLVSLAALAAALAIIISGLGGELIAIGALMYRNVSGFNRDFVLLSLVVLLVAVIAGPMANFAGTYVRLMASLGQSTARAHRSGRDQD